MAEAKRPSSSPFMDRPPSFALQNLLFALLGLMCLGPAGCSAQGAENDQVAFEVISQGDLSGIPNQRMVVIRTDQELNDLYLSLTLNQLPEINTVDIDFSMEMLIGIFLGNTLQSCLDSVEVPGVTRIDDAIQVNVSIELGNSSALCGFSPTQPYVIIKTARVDNYVRFSTDVIPYAE